MTNNLMITEAENSFTYSSNMKIKLLHQSEYSFVKLKLNAVKRKSKLTYYNFRFIDGKNKFKSRAWIERVVIVGERSAPNAAEMTTSGINIYFFTTENREMNITCM